MPNLSSAHHFRLLAGSLVEVSGPPFSTPLLEAGEGLAGCTVPRLRCSAAVFSAERPKFFFALAVLRATHACPLILALGFGELLLEVRDDALPVAAEAS